MLRKFLAYIGIIKEKEKEKAIPRCNGCSILMDYEGTLHVGGHAVTTSRFNFKEQSREYQCYNCYRFILLNNKINHLMGLPPTNKGP